MPLSSLRLFLFSLLFLTSGFLASPARAIIVFFPPSAPADASGLWFELGQPDSRADDPMLLPVQCYSKSCDDEPGTGAGASDLSEASGAGKGLSSSFTRRIVRIIKHANETCDHRILPEYVIDCLRVYYGWAADEIPDRGDYAPVKKALRRAEKQLSAIVSANVDRKAPVILPREGHKPGAKKLPPLRAVKKGSTKKAAAKAKAVVQETELVILRSGEDPARRTEHFQEVASAVDSNLVILRSA